MNVVLLIVDSLRADFLSEEKTPFLKKMAQEGLVFPNTYCQAHPTKPALASLFSSRYAFEHGVYDICKKLDPAQSLPLRLASAGIETGYIGGGIHIRKEEGFYGFKTHQYVDIDLQKPQPHSARMKPFIESFVKRFSQKPFFLALHYLDVHEPLFDGRQFRFISSAKEISECYRSALEQLDARLKDLFRLFEAQRILSETVFILTADNGMEKNSLHEPLEGSVNESIIRIPLFLFGKNLSGIHAEPVEAIDIMPAVFDLFRVPLPPVSGQSLLSSAYRKQKVVSELKSQSQDELYPGFYYYVEMEGAQKRVWKQAVPADRHELHWKLSYWKSFFRQHLLLARFSLATGGKNAQASAYDLMQDHLEEHPLPLNEDFTIPSRKKAVSSSISAHAENEMRKMGYLK